VKNLEYDELAKWMEKFAVGDQLRTWIVNDMLGRRNYGLLEDLVTRGKAVISVIINAEGRIFLQKVEEVVREVVKIEPKQEPSIVEASVTQMQEPQETPQFVPKKVRRKTDL
jgi:hypothetical protein